MPPLPAAIFAATAIAYFSASASAAAAWSERTWRTPPLSRMPLKGMGRDATIEAGRDGRVA